MEVFFFTSTEEAEVNRRELATPAQLRACRIDHLSHRRRRSPATPQSNVEEYIAMDEMTKKYLTAAALLAAAAGASEIAATNSGIDLGDVEASCHQAAQNILDSVEGGPPALGVQTPTPPPPPPQQPQRPPARQPRR